VYELIADVGVVSDQFDLEGYFGSHTEVPKYSLVYTSLLKNRAFSIPAVRRAQKAFEESIVGPGSSVNATADATKTFIVFGKSGPVLQSEEGASHIFWGAFDHMCDTNRVLVRWKEAAQFGLDGCKILKSFLILLIFFILILNLLDPFSKTLRVEN
jgi:hypothetical protein